MSGGVWRVLVFSTTLLHTVGKSLSAAAAILRPCSYGYRFPPGEEALAQRIRPHERSEGSLSNWTCNSPREPRGSGPADATAAYDLTF